MPPRQFEPHYRRIITDIRGRVASGEWPPGHKLPSTRELADLYEVRSQSTIRQAITILIETGELYGHQGLGVFVSKKSPDSAWSENYLQPRPNGSPPIAWSRSADDTAAWRDLCRRTPGEEDPMASIADIKAGLANGKTEAERALAQLTAVNAQVDQAIALLQALAAGTEQPAVMGAIGNLGAAKQKFGEGANLIRAAITQTEKYSSVL